ncbi:hypothetical protein V5799_012376 [Amblyomma americanum]|uniref:PID domain-containing protein n=1 Tax=Amblyomma americanum TaxID=6943 RepID=A0AAQ4EEN7_AMBAM
MGRLKEAVRACREQKQRVQLTISLQGIKIRDDKTWALLFYHPVRRILFIPRGTSDARVAGYIYMAQDDSFIATEKAAAELQEALVALFQVALDAKESGLRVAQQVWRHQLLAWAPTTCLPDFYGGRTSRHALRTKLIARGGPGDGEISRRQDQPGLTSHIRPEVLSPSVGAALPVLIHSAALVLQFVASGKTSPQLHRAAQGTLP